MFISWNYPGGLVAFPTTPYMLLNGSPNSFVLKFASNKLKSPKIRDLHLTFEEYLGYFLMSL